MSKVGVVSLGCDKNRVDTEKMLAILANSNNTLVDTLDNADIVIVNTCAFIHDAKEESVDCILDIAEFKDKKIIVTGCLSKRYADELIREIPEVFAVMGTNQYTKINEVISKVKEGQRVKILEDEDYFTSERILTTIPHYAYLKISDGCNNHCTYCSIPSIRGKYKSYPIEGLVEESKKLADEGVKELILVAQDVSRYGEDLYGQNKLIELLTEIEKLEFSTVRLLYMYPEKISDRLIEYIANSKKIAKYLDVPFQHASNKILKLMNRRQTKEEYVELISKLRKVGITIRSTFIVGFPNESKEDFEELKDFIKTQKIEYAGFFSYSREDGTPADKMKGHISKRVKEARLDEVRKIQDSNMLEMNKNKIGSVLEVTYDDISYDESMFIGHTEMQMPGIDTCVLFKSDDVLNVGEKYNIKIIDADAYNLFGEKI